MKKLSFILVLALLLIGFNSAAFASGSSHTCAGPVTIGGYGDSNTVTITCSWVGDSYTGAVPSVDVGEPLGYYPYQVDINPGTPAPVAATMTLTFLIGSSTFDLINGSGTAVSAATATWKVLTSGGVGFRRNIGTITGNVTNTVAGAKGSYTITSISK